MNVFPWLLTLSIFLTIRAPVGVPVIPEQTAKTSEAAEMAEARLITNQILEGEEGALHYSYYLSEGYDETKRYPMMIAMPGYDRMWFGESSAGSNLDWNGFCTWFDRDDRRFRPADRLA